MHKSSAQFVDWLSKNHQKIHLMVNDLNWIGDFFPGYFDVEASISIGEKPFLGRGQSDVSREVAVEKAITEAIERAVLQATFPEAWNSDLAMSSLVCEEMTTSGFSLHTDEEAAIWSATLELIERDLFFCHYLTGQPFEACDQHTANDSLFIKAQEQLAPQGVELKLGQLHASAHFSCHICTAFGGNGTAGRDFGVILGMGCASDAVSAVNKAVLECVPNVVAHIKGYHTRVLSLDDFLALNRFGPLDHLALGKNRENDDYMQRLFAHRPEDSSRKVGDEDFFWETEIKTVELPAWCRNSGLVAMRAYNPNLQKIYFGPSQKEKINLPRLASFCGRAISFEELHLYPHPFP